MDPAPLHPSYTRVFHEGPVTVDRQRISALERMETQLLDAVLVHGHVFLDAGRAPEGLTLDEYAQLLQAASDLARRRRLGSVSHD